MVFSTTAFAQIRPGAFSVSPFYGGYIFEGNQDLDDSYILGLRGGYDFTKNWGVEAVFDWVPTENEKTNVYNYRVEGLYHFMPEERLVPFVAVGIGGQSIDYNGPERNRTRPTADYGVGLKYFVTDWLALRGDVRHVLAFGSVYNNLEYVAGLQFYFGGKKKEAPPVAEIKKAPEAVPEAVLEVEKKLLEEGRARINVEFDFDKSNIRPRYHDEIKQVADFMVKYPNAKVAIEGHTDSIGTNEYNQKLSLRRADSVKNYLVDKFNIDGKRLKSEGYGETKPIADNNTDEGRQRNRRVESVLIRLDKN